MRTTCSTGPLAARTASGTGSRFARRTTCAGCTWGGCGFGSYRRGCSGGNWGWKGERRGGCWCGPRRSRRPGRRRTLEHVWHLRDIDELGYLERVRRTLREKRPQLPDVDGDRLAAERAYLQRALQPAQRTLLQGRRRAVARIRRLEEKDFRREAVLEGAGPLTLGDLVLRWRAHDIGHRVEMERLAAVLRA